MMGIRVEGREYSMAFKGRSSSPLGKFRKGPAARLPLEVGIFDHFVSNTRVARESSPDGRVRLFSKGNKSILLLGVSSSDLSMPKVSSGHSSYRSYMIARMTDLIFKEQFT